MLEKAILMIGFVNVAYLYERRISLLRRFLSVQKWEKHGLQRGGITSERDCTPLDYYYGTGIKKTDRELERCQGTCPDL